MTVGRAQREATSRLERERRRVIPWVFHRRGERLYSLRSGWRTAVRKAGLPGLTPHDLRRSAARNLIRAGVQQAIAMKITGHKTNSMFKRYNITDERGIRDAVLKTQEYLKNISSDTNVLPFKRAVE